MGYLGECPTITLGNPPDRGALLDKGVKILKEIVIDSSNIKVHKTRSSIKDECSTGLNNNLRSTGQFRPAYSSFRAICRMGWDGWGWLS